MRDINNKGRPVSRQPYFDLYLIYFIVILLPSFNVFVPFIVFGSLFSGSFFPSFFLLFIFYLAYNCVCHVWCLTLVHNQLVWDLPSVYLCLVVVIYTDDINSLCYAWITAIRLTRQISLIPAKMDAVKRVHFMLTCRQLLTDNCIGYLANLMHYLSSYQW